MRHPEQGRRGPSDIRRNAPKSLRIVLVVVAVVLIAAVAFLVVRSCSSGGAPDQSSQTSEITNQPAPMTREEQVAQAKTNFVGSWALGAITWEGEAADASTFPSRIVISENGECLMLQSDAETRGIWDVDGNALVVTLKDASGTDVTRLLTTDGNQMALSMSNGTGSYVRISRSPVTDGSGS